MPSTKPCLTLPVKVRFFLGTLAPFERLLLVCSAESDEQASQLQGLYLNSHDCIPWVQAHVADTANTRDPLKPFLEPLEALPKPIHAWLQAYIAGDSVYCQQHASHLYTFASLGGTPFQQRVWQALTHIPWGSHWTYQQVATAVGSPQGQQAVGQALKRNPLSLVIPCHRVQRTNGQAGGYANGETLKSWLLQHEQKPFSLVKNPPSFFQPVS